MGIRKYVTVMCDGWSLGDRRSADCEGQWGDAFETVDDARRLLRENGWTVGKLVLCPKCARSRRAPAGVART